MQKDNMMSTDKDDSDNNTGTAAGEGRREEESARTITSTSSVTSRMNDADLEKLEQRRAYNRK